MNVDDIVLGFIGAMFIGGALGIVHGCWIVWRNRAPTSAAQVRERLRLEAEIVLESLRPGDECPACSSVQQQFGTMSHKLNCRLMFESSTDQQQIGRARLPRDGWPVAFAWWLIRRSNR